MMLQLEDPVLRSARAESEPSWSAVVPAGAWDTARAAALLAARLPPALGVLADVAYDYAWTWQPDADTLFRAIDPHRWETSRHNPIRLLLETPVTNLARAAEDHDLLARAAALDRALTQARSRPFRSSEIFSPARPIAFLCAEFGVHQSLPIYAGGLGVLAGDLLKEASDRGVPLVGVGIYYRHGYFHQRLDASGGQHEHWIESDPELLPLALVTNSDGSPRTVSVRVRGRDVVLQIWRAAVGRTSLYLLDADHPANPRVDRWITARLYESEREVRLTQYAVLGIGGVRALRALALEPSVVHLNEGHAAFAALELAREAIASGSDPEEALDGARRRIVFTTHTPVAAGNEAYGREELWRVLDGLPEELGLDAERILALGRVRPDDPEDALGMTVLALRTSRRANAVSRRHGEVSREMWASVWPGASGEVVPIDHVTNGVHLPTWMSVPMRRLLGRHLGEGWEETAVDPAVWERVESIPDEEIWAVRNRVRADLVEYVRDRSVAHRLQRAESNHVVEAAARAFDPGALTLGFARRVAAYKRLHLLAWDPLRALDLLRGEEPVQIVIAGKAHPRDDEAKHLVKRIFEMREQTGAIGRVIFIEDYDLDVGARLVAGCDVWVNLPRPPLEASGTSGMKAVLNGALNLSVLDGWWAEAWDPTAGWSIPATPVADEAARDARDGTAFYDLLERDVRPLFYERDEAGIPRGWVRRIKASLRLLGPRFCSGRMLEEYVGRVYPSA